MCDPVTMLASVAAGGKLFEGLASGASHGMSAELAEKNAELLGIQSDIARRNADVALTRGNWDEFLLRRKGAHVQAAQTTHFAAGHVDPTYGSPLVQQGHVASQIETDAQLIRARMLGERADAMTQSANIAGQAAGQKYKASAERAAELVSFVTAPINAATAYMTATKLWPGLHGGPGATTSTIGANPFALSAG